MLKTPFAVSDIIIPLCVGIFKCAILILFLPLQVDDGSRNLPQAGF
jgi:hypothetical protein